MGAPAWAEENIALVSVGKLTIFRGTFTVLLSLGLFGVALC